MQRGFQAEQLEDEEVKVVVGEPKAEVPAVRQRVAGNDNLHGLDDKVPDVWQPGPEMAALAPTKER